MPFSPRPARDRPPPGDLLEAVERDVHSLEADDEPSRRDGSAPLLIALGSLCSIDQVIIALARDLGAAPPTQAG